MRLFLLLLFIAPARLLGAEDTACLQNINSAENLDRWHENFDCRELQIGEMRLVKQEWNQSPTGLAAKYVLHRKSEQEYEIDIPIYIVDKLSRARSKARGGASTKSEKMMEDRIRLCAAASDSFLKGPNGEKLKLNPILSKQERKPWHRDMVESVAVVNTNKHDFRSDSANIGKDVDCAIIIHELLHHLGLVDEYLESDYKSPSLTGFKYDCRVLGPEDSIMADNHEAFRQLGEVRNQQRGLNYEIKASVCQKIGSDKSCTDVEITTPIDLKPNEQMTAERAKQAFKNFYSHKKPGSKDQALGPDSPSMAPNLTKSKPRKQQQEISIVQYKPVVTKLNPNSILEPAHFRAIVYPGCVSKNALYYKCSRYSYVTSKKDSTSSGSQVDIQSECKVPPECRVADWLK